MFYVMIWRVNKMICIYRISNWWVLLEELCVKKEQFGNIDGSAIKAHCDFNEKNAVHAPGDLDWNLLSQCNFCLVYNKLAEKPN